MPWLELEMSQLAVRDLRVGGRYLHSAGQLVRVIDGIQGGVIQFHDESAPLSCSKKEFLETIQAEVPTKQEFSSELIQRVFGSDVDGQVLIRWHETLKTHCALVQHHCNWLWSGLHNYEAQILGGVGYDHWRWLDGHLDAVKQSAAKLQGTLTSFEPD